MNPTAHQCLSLDTNEFTILTELLETARTRLLIEIRHMDHRAFRDELRERLTTVESLLNRCRALTGSPA